MGKCVIPYVLLLFFSVVFIDGFAANTQAIKKTAGRELNVKIYQSFGDIPLHNDAKGSFTRHIESIAPSVNAAHFIAENILVMSYPAFQAGRIISIPVIKHNQKDHLLHLFPSHYFW